MPQIIMSQQTSTYLGAEETKTVSQRDIKREKIQTERKRERDTEDEGLVRRYEKREDDLKRLGNKERERDKGRHTDRERLTERKREKDLEDEGLVRRCVNREDYLKRLANKEKEREIKVVIHTEASKGRIMELFR